MMRTNILAAILLAGSLPLGAAAQVVVQPSASTVTVERGKVWFNRGPHAVVMKKDQSVTVVPGDRFMLLHDARAHVNWADGTKATLYSCDLFIVGAPSADAGERNSVVRVDAMFRHPVGYYVGDDDSGDRCWLVPWIWGPGAAVIGAMLQPGPEHTTRGPPISSP